MRRNVLIKYLLPLVLAVLAYITLAFLAVKALYGVVKPVWKPEFFYWFFAILSILLVGVIVFSIYRLMRHYDSNLRDLHGQTKELALSSIKRSNSIQGSHRWRALLMEEISQEADPFDNNITQLVQNDIELMSLCLNHFYEEIHTKNEQLQAVMANMQEGVIIVDTKGRYKFMTARVKEFFGEQKTGELRLELLGTNYNRLFALCSENLPLEDEEVKRFKMTVSYPKERMFKIYVRHMVWEERDDDREAYLIVVRDVSRVEHLENLRSEFVANVTHELKTPLTSISGYLELLMSAERDAKTRQSFYEIIEIETKRLKDLIQDLLVISELEQKPNASGDKQAYNDISIVVKDIMRELQPLAISKEVELINSMPEHLIIVGSYKQQLQLLSNLISNAVRYNKKFGYVEVSAKLERDSICILVEDNGIGIKPEDQTRIFERFYRVHKERARTNGGNGLGLSIVKHLVNSLGGSISLDSQENKGSCFKIYFPNHKLLEE